MRAPRFLMARRAAAAARGAAAALLVTVGLTGCQFLFPTPIEQAADTRPSGAVRAIGEGFLPGERLRAEVHLDGVVAGVGELRAGARCLAEGRTVVPVVSTGKSAGIVRMFQSATSDVRTLMDVETSTPIEAAWDVKLGERRQTIEQLFSEARFRFEQVREVPEKKPSRSFGDVVVPIDGAPHDGHTSLGYLRHWKPEPGSRGHMYTVYGRSVWRADLTYRGVEGVTTALGTQRASRIDGVATKLLGKTLKASQLTPRRPFTMWISDDARRVPLRVLLETALAKVSLEIVAYDHDTSLAEAAPVACAPRVDAASITKGLAARKKREEDRRRKKEADAAAAAAAAARGEPAESDEPETEDEREEREDREAVEKLLRP